MSGPASDAAFLLALPTRLAYSRTPWEQMSTVGQAYGILSLCCQSHIQLAGLFITSGPAALSALADTSLVKLQTLPQVLGILAFVYAGHSTFPVIQQSMAAPTKAPRCGVMFVVGPTTVRKHGQDSCPHPDQLYTVPMMFTAL
eukprot:GHUV01039973.1.p1 GENE.GHUV01039973.1~~GHUV01039973.1.p1  ORF type:complete len:143 (+),score=11.66 GHUV01039973.1:263-691(+)